jgi:hypothetical protein
MKPEKLKLLKIIFNAVTGLLFLCVSYLNYTSKQGPLFSPHILAAITFACALFYFVRFFQALLSKPGKM